MGFAHQSLKHLYTFSLFFLFFLISVFSTTTVFAEGFYLGAGLLAHSEQGKINFSGSVTNVVAVMVPTVNTPQEIEVEVLVGPDGVAAQNSDFLGMSNTNIGLNALAGYTFPIMPQFSLTLQGDATTGTNRVQMFQQHFSSPNLFLDNIPLNVSYQVSELNQHSFGLSLIPQWHLNFYPYPSHKRQSSLLFLGGYRYGLFKSNLDVTDQIVGVTHDESKTWRHGLELGLGAQVSLSQHIDIRLLTSQTYYQKKQIFQNVSALNWAATSKARVDQVTLDLIWRA